MPKRSENGKASLLAFFLEWAAIKRWHVPAIHIRACHWLETCGDLAVLRCFRGFGKSSILGIYNAWRYYVDPTHRLLHQGADDQMAYKTSRDTQHVLRTHPWTRGLLPKKPGPVEQWWVQGSDDERNASMFAKGITSTTTSSRADECQNDDVEVPKNIQNPEAREKMRLRLGEQVHIMVPGARQLFVGTPHTHDSLYDEQERLGADCLTIRMFEQEHRIEKADSRVYRLPFVPQYVFSGIGEFCKVLLTERDYTLDKSVITFHKPPGTLVDFYAGSAWPERFDFKEMQKRRRKTRTINEWDSQYQLHSKPVTEVRLDPERITPYAVEPNLTFSNSEHGMWLGNVRIAGASLRWDPASGKVNSDVSALALCLQDEAGRRYLHRVQALLGDIAEFGPDGKTITGGQVFQICDLVQRYQLPRVTLEGNGIGKFAPAVLKGALRQRRLQCGVTEVISTDNKNKRILESLEPLLLANRQLWAHVDVLNGPLWDQMKDWNPALRNQADDYLDAAAGAVSETPERIQRAQSGLIAPANTQHDWRPDAGVHEVEVEY